MKDRHMAVAKEIREGRMVRQPCEVCGMKPSLTRYTIRNRLIEYQNVVAHHDDHSKLLEVRWLCKMHHAAYHKAQGSYRNNGRKSERLRALGVIR
jgi:hypothetical protein